MTKLQFQYTKRAREKNPAECRYAQTVIRRALPYAVDQFSIPWKKVRVKIDILEKEKGSKKVTLGYAEVVNGEYCIVINCADTRLEEEYVNTFGHELTHCEQYYRRRLQYTPHKNMVLWEGKPMEVVAGKTDAEFTHYYNAPWEVEARENADRFYGYYRTERKKKTWWGRFMIWLRLNAM